MKAKVEIPVGQPYEELLCLAALLTMRTSGFLFERFEPVCELRLSCDRSQRSSVLRLFICGEIMASDN